MANTSCEDVPAEMGSLKTKKKDFAAKRYVQHLVAALGDERSDGCIKQCHIKGVLQEHDANCDETQRVSSHHHFNNGGVAPVSERAPGPAPIAPHMAAAMAPHTQDHSHYNGAAQFGYSASPTSNFLGVADPLAGGDQASYHVHYAMLMQQHQQHQQQIQIQAQQQHQPLPQHQQHPQQPQPQLQQPPHMQQHAQPQLQQQLPPPMPQQQQPQQSMQMQQSQMSPQGAGSCAAATSGSGSTTGSGVDDLLSKAAAGVANMSFEQRNAAAPQQAPRGTPMNNMSSMGFR
mmetsp:Transcript_58684/g.139826  ORF Transcript_58684/g.139826 Transcript_58684/m.139826 type:complete len:288 (+) Transcript_58684:102-965(+)